MSGKQIVDLVFFWQLKSPEKCCYSKVFHHQHLLAGLQTILVTTHLLELWFENVFQCILNKRQDWHYASILGLRVCIVVRIISTKNHFRQARHDLPHPACTFVCDTSGSVKVTITTPLRQWKHRLTRSTAHCHRRREQNFYACTKHSALFSDDNGQYFV